MPILQSAYTPPAGPAARSKTRAREFLIMGVGKILIQELKCPSSSLGPRGRPCAGGEGGCRRTAFLKLIVIDFSGFHGFPLRDTHTSCSKFSGPQNTPKRFSGRRFAPPILNLPKLHGPAGASRRHCPGFSSFPALRAAKHHANPSTYPLSF